MNFTGSDSLGDGHFSSPVFGDSEVLFSLVTQKDSNGTFYPSLKMSPDTCRPVDYGVPQWAPARVLYLQFVILVVLNLRTLVRL